MSEELDSKKSQENNSQKDIALVYMVAGMSSRFGGKVKQFAKIDSKGTTLIEKSIEQALPAGFTKIIFIVGHKTEKAFKEMFGSEHKGIPVHYANQTFDPELRERPWGTTDAVCSAKNLIDCPFVLANGDDLYGENSFKTIVNHLKNNSDGHGATIGYNIMKVTPEEGTTNRGIFQKDKEDYLESIEEVLGINKQNLNESNLDENALCSMNIFGLPPETVHHLNEILEKFKEENKGDKKIECLLPVELGNLIKQNKIKMKVHSTPDTWYGVTNPGDELIIQKALEES